MFWLQTTKISREKRSDLKKTRYVVTFYWRDYVHEKKMKPRLKGIKTINESKRDLNRKFSLHWQIDKGNYFPMKNSSIKQTNVWLPFSLWHLNLFIPFKSFAACLTLFCQTIVFHVSSCRENWSINVVLTFFVLIEFVNKLTKLTDVALLENINCAINFRPLTKLNSFFFLKT